MSYSKTTWATGDVITAAKLNNIEDGVAANDMAIAGLVPFTCEGTLGVDGDEKATITLDKKAGELYAAVSGGKVVKVFSEVTEGVTSETIAPCTACKFVSGDVATYEFRCVTTDAKAFSVSSLGANDTVVLTEEA